MNKKFLQSVSAGLLGLTLVASCSYLGIKKESNFCGAKNGCAAKKDEAHKCSSAKDEANKCSATKTKKAKKAKKTTEVKAEVKTEAKN
jgi:hypothetical protein